MEPRHCLNSIGPQGPTHTNPRPHPLLFVLPSFLCECDWLCVCVCVCVNQSVFVCFMWLFHWNDCPGTKTLLEEIQEHFSGPILTLSLSLYIFPSLLRVTIEAQFNRKRCNTKVVYCHASPVGLKKEVRSSSKCLNQLLQRKTRSWKNVKIMRL